MVRIVNCGICKQGAALVNKILCSVFGILLSVAAFAVPAEVEYVIDGDTFAAVVKIEDDIGIPVHVRLINNDTPELKGACAKEIEMANQAKDVLANLLPVGFVVDLQNIQDDKYLGRIDANVVLPDGRDVGEILIQEGLARPYSGGRRLGWCD